MTNTNYSELIKELILEGDQNSDIYNTVFEELVRSFVSQGIIKRKDLNNKNSHKISLVAI